MTDVAARSPDRLGRVLDAVERAGNAIPHPALLFLWLAVGVLLVSALGQALGWSAVNPATGETVEAVSLLSRAGVQEMLTGAVTNFTGFAPLGVVLVAMLGIGVAEHSGLLATLLTRFASAVPARALAASILFAGVLSSIGGDAGIVVLPPLAASLFLAAGRHPIAGLVTAYVGVAAGFTANLLIGPTDALLAGLSTEAVALVDPAYRVTAAGNWWFVIASTFLVTAVCALVTERIVEPRLGAFHTSAATEVPGADSGDSTGDDADAQRRGLRAAGLVSLVLAALLLAALVPEQGVLRDPQTRSIVASPFMDGIVVVIAFWAAACGVAYGNATGRFRSAADAIVGMEATMRVLAAYLVLIFFAAQFVTWFGASRLGTILAIRGADALQALDVGPTPLLLAFVLLVATLNLFIGSQSAKWAVLGPVFIPMFYLVGISPEATQMAYRIGDSTTNVITPLIPYLALVVTIARRYEPRTGIGTLMAAMLPYSVALLLAWSVLLALWILFDVPLGPGASILLPR